MTKTTTLEMTLLHEHMYTRQAIQAVLQHIGYTS